jgi:Asp-tRNA(Asn)/Glu-tRNA(Gln) amidotransferase A subunit family amidase
VLSATETAIRVRTGELSPAALIEEQLALIDALDEQVKAWMHVDQAGAREAAQEIEAASRRDGALLGVSAAIKDIIDVAGLPTGFGAPFARRLPEHDATVVRRLREAGAIVLGKTETTQFAYSDPAPTRNPWDLEHTPGGSSSGSAAAVAAGMATVALGSQTVGSTLRPAAYCGIVGLKATHGRISAAGVFPLAWSLDHVGIFARSVADAALVLSVIASHDPADPYSLDAPLDDYVAAIGRDTAPPVLGLSRRFYQEIANAEVNDHLDAVVGQLKEDGAEVREVEIPLTPREIRELGEPVLRAEAAAAHVDLFEAHPEGYRPLLRALVENGLRTTALDYIRAQAARRRLREQLLAALEGFDALLLPAAPSTAPRDLTTTGDPILCAPASSAGLPAIALPSGLSNEGLPLSVQLFTRPLAEAHLLSVAAWVERVLGFRATPPLVAAATS